MEPPRHSTRMIVPAPEPPDTVLAPHPTTRSTHPSRYTLIHVATVHRRPLHAARRSHYRTLLCSTGQTIRLQSSLERSTSLSELVCGPTQAGAYHTRSILHALALADNPRAPHASTSPSYRPYPPPEPHPQMAQRRLHTASSQLHHSFITASSPLHHSFITASSRLHHSDQQYSTHCNAQPSHSKSRPTRMAWSPYHPPAYQGICCLRTWLVHRHCGGTRHNPKPALTRTRTGSRHAHEQEADTARTEYALLDTRNRLQPLVSTCQSTLVRILLNPTHGPSQTPMHAWRNTTSQYHTHHPRGKNDLHNQPS